MTEIQKEGEEPEESEPVKVLHTVIGGVLVAVPVLVLLAWVAAWTVGAHGVVMWGVPPLALLLLVWAVRAQVIRRGHAVSGLVTALGDLATVFVMGAFLAWCLWPYMWRLLQGLFFEWDD